MMFVKSMSGPHIPQQEDAKILFAALKDLLGCFAGSSRIDGEGWEQRGLGWSGAESPLPTPGVARALGVGVGQRWDWASL